MPRLSPTDWTVKDIGVEERRDGRRFKYIVAIGTTIITIGPCANRSACRHEAARLLQEDRHGVRAF
jgi:hypothetical protein